MNSMAKLAQRAMMRGLQCSEGIRSRRAADVEMRGTATWLIALVLLMVASPALAIETLDFGTFTSANLQTTPINANVGGITATVTATNSGGPWDSAPELRTNIAGPNGTTGVVLMRMDAAVNSTLPWTQVTFTFSRPVTSLTFNVGDIDGGPNYEWNDRIVFDSVPAMTPTVVTLGSQLTWNASTRTAQSVANTNSNTIDSNIRIRFPQPVTQVSVRYVAAPVANGGGDGPNQQSVGIDDLTWDSGVVRVNKSTSPDFGGPFSFAQTNLLSSPASITTTAANTPTPASPTAHEINGPGTNVALTETLPSGWILNSVSCTDANSAVTGNSGALGSLSGSTVTLNASNLVLSGANITCTFANGRQQTDIQVVKTAAPNPVLSGDVVSYSLVVTNNGPLTANNVVLTDTPSAGQNCSVPSTSATCTATGGASCPSATVPVSSLTGGGITIPVLPVGGQVTLALQCTISANGL